MTFLLLTLVLPPLLYTWGHVFDGKSQEYQTKMILCTHYFLLEQAGMAFYMIPYCIVSILKCTNYIWSTLFERHLGFIVLPQVSSVFL